MERNKHVGATFFSFYLSVSDGMYGSWLGLNFGDMSGFELDLCWIATGWAIYRKVKGVPRGAIEILENG